MSTPSTVGTSTVFATRRRQLGLLVRRELVGQLLRWRGAWIHPLAFAPLLVILVHAFNDPGDAHRLSQESTVYSGIFHFFYLRMALFFAAAALLSRAFRGEIVERTLHYAFLAPVRRELIVLGKFMGGLLALLLVFGAAVTASFVAMYAHFPEGLAYLSHAAGLRELGQYLAATALACIGYSAMFLACGLIFRNVALPAVGLFALEVWSGVLPPMLQRLTVSYYLKSISPTPPPADGVAALLTVVAEPIPAWLAVTGLLLLASAVLTAASLRVRSMEINYTTD